MNIKIADITPYHLVSCPDCGAETGAPCHDSKGKIDDAVHVSRVASYKLRSPAPSLRRVEN